MAARRVSPLAASIYLATRFSLWRGLVPQVPACMRCGQANMHIVSTAGPRPAATAQYDVPPSPLSLPHRSGAFPKRDSRSDTRRVQRVGLGFQYAAGSRLGACRG